ncbi:MAG: helix-turn-helix domain-containing protein [Fusobacterium sp.]
MELALLLKKYRESRNLSIKQLSQLAGVGNGTIGEIERGKNKSRPATLEKLSKALKLTSEERERLFSCLVPKDIGKKIIEASDPRVLELNKRELSQFEKTMEEASLFFNDETVSEEDKQKMVLAISKLFFESKEMNKDKYKKNKDK